jgi:hypothetical protein
VPHDENRANGVVVVRLKEVVDGRGRIGRKALQLRLKQRRDYYLTFSDNVTEKPPCSRYVK